MHTKLLVRVCLPGQRGDQTRFNDSSPPVQKQGLKGAPGQGRPCTPMFQVSVQLVGLQGQHFALTGQATTSSLWAARLAALPGVPQIESESVNPTCQPAQPVGAQVKRFAA